jgi:hypothetical protein
MSLEDGKSWEEEELAKELAQEKQTAWENAVRKIYAEEAPEVVKRIVETEHELYTLRGFGKGITSLLVNGHHLAFSDVLKNCIRSYVGSQVPSNVTLNIIEDSLMDEEFPEEKAMVPRRGAVPEVGDKSKAYEICCHITNLPADFEEAKFVSGIRTTTYLGDMHRVEKEILCMAVKSLGNELVKNIAYFSDYEVADVDTIKCDINCCSVLIDIEHKKLRFSLVTAFQCRVYSDVKEKVGA